MNIKKNKLENFNEITISYDSLNLKIKKLLLFEIKIKFC